LMAWILRNSGRLVRVVEASSDIDALSWCVTAL
jgi:hypothetical protein